MPCVLATDFRIASLQRFSIMPALSTKPFPSTAHAVEIVWTLPKHRIFPDVDRGVPIWMQELLTRVFADRLILWNVSQRR